MIDTVGSYNDSSKTFADDSFKWTPTELIEKFASMLLRNTKIIDIGCGAGRDTKLFNEKGFVTVGLDASEKLIAYATSKFPEIQFVTASMQNIPFPNESFGAVWCHAALLHLETLKDVRKTLQEFSRILKSNGILYIYTKAYVSGRKTEILSNYFFKKPRFFRYFRVKELVILLSEAGFKIIEIKEISETGINQGGRPNVRWIYSFSTKK